MEERVDANGKKLRWVTAIYFILSGLMVATWSSRIPEVQQKLALPNAAWGTVLFALPLGMVSGLFVASWLSARFGLQKIIVGSVLSCALLLALAGMSASRIGLMMVLYGTGFSRTVLNISMNTRAVEVQKLYTRPIISSFHGLWSLACFAAAAIGTFMIVIQAKPAIHFIAMSVFCLVVLILIRRNPFGKDHLVPGKKSFFIRPDKYLFLLGGMAFSAMLCENILFDWSVNYFEKEVNPGKAMVTAGYTSFILAMTLGRLAGDHIVARFGSLRILAINGFLITGGFLMAAVFPFLAPAALGFLLVGIGDSVVVPVVYTLAARSKKMLPGYAISSVTLIGYAGFLIAPLFMGSISDLFGMQWAMGIVGLMGLVISWLAMEVKKFIENDQQ